MTDKVVTYSHWYPDWYPGSTGIPVQHWNIPTVNRGEKTRTTPSSHKRMKRNLFRPSALDTFIHSLHVFRTPAFCIHRWHPFFIPSAFLLVSCLFSFIMLSCCEEKQFVNERSKRGRRQTLRATTVSFSLSCVCGAFLRGSLCGRSVYTSVCGDRAKMVRLCGSLCPHTADVFWISLIVLQTFWIANFGIQIRQGGNVWSRVCRLLS